MFIVQQMRLCNDRGELQNYDHRAGVLPFKSYQQFHDKISYYVPTARG